MLNFHFVYLHYHITPSHHTTITVLVSIFALTWFQTTLDHFRFSIDSHFGMKRLAGSIKKPAAASNAANTFHIWGEIFGFYISFCVYVYVSANMQKKT